jgi:hypothetical protein
MSRRVVWQKPEFRKRLLPPSDALQMMAAGSYETTRCHVPQHMRTSHLTHNTELLWDLTFTGLKFNFEILSFLFLILFHDCLSRAWVHLKTTLDRDMPHYNGTLITAKCQFCTLSFIHLFVQYLSNISIMLPNITPNTTDTYPYHITAENKQKKSADDLLNRPHVLL